MSRIGEFIETDNRSVVFRDNEGGEERNWGLTAYWL